MIPPIGLVDTLPETPQMSLLFSVNLCPKYMCMSSCSHYLPFEVLEEARASTGLCVDVSSGVMI